MVTESRTSKLNRLLVQSQALYRSILRVYPDIHSDDPTEIDSDWRPVIGGAFFLLLHLIDEIDGLLEEVKLDGAIESLHSEPLAFYRQTIKPGRPEIEKVFARYREYLDEDADWSQWDNRRDDGGAWDILVAGFDYFSQDEDAYSKEQLDTVERLLFSSFFTPDEWLRNSKDLDPILGESADQRIPSHVRIRVKELYRSYMLGNYLSAIALGRAILEYSLVDRAPIIDINPYSADPNNTTRTRTLRSIVEDVSKIAPELSVDMESIVDAGNRTLHPKKRDKVVLHPSTLRSLSRDTINSVQRVIEHLYLRL